MRGCRGQIDDQAGEVRWELTFATSKGTPPPFEKSTRRALCSSPPGTPFPYFPAVGQQRHKKAADVIGVAGGAAQGIANGDFDDLVRAVRAGAAYVNVHSTTRPAGEVRAQLGGTGKDG